MTKKIGEQISVPYKDRPMSLFYKEEIRMRMRKGKTYRVTVEEIE